MQNFCNYYAVSIESRKGGVGKTTAALNLARMCHDSKKYEIIFFDLDITGTEAAGFKNIPIWREYAHVVPNPLSTDGFSHRNKEDANLVEMFERYMTGDSLKEILSTKSNEKSNAELPIKTEKINIFSSFLSREGYKNEEKKTRYGPAALFDELHSQWFIEMLKELAQECIEFFKQKNSNKKILIVIDNAPGYSGLEPAVEEWLTDLGPEYGKFLVVSSLDLQDMKACMIALANLHNLYCSKWDASREFIKLINSSKKVDLNKLDEKGKEFFQRLIESVPAVSGEENKCKYVSGGNVKTLSAETAPLSCTDCGLCFYCQPIIEPHKQTHPYGEIFKRNQSKYLGLLYNKVNPAITKKDYDVNLKTLLEELGCKTEKSIVRFDDLAKSISESNNSKIIIPAAPFNTPYSKMVVYEPAYALQFLAHLLTGTAAKPLVKEKTKITEEILKLTEDMEAAKQKFSKEIESFEKEDSWRPKIENGIDIVFTFDSGFIDINEKFRKFDIKGENKFYDKDFLFSSSLIPLVVYFIMKLNPAIKEKEASAIAIDIASDSASARDIARAIARDIAIAIARDIARAIARASARDMVVILTSMVILSESKRGKTNLQNHFMEQYHNESDSIKLVQRIHNNTDAKERIKKLEISTEKLAELYRGLCYSLVRFWDMKKDFPFLIDCLKTIIYIKDTSSVVLAAIKDTARKAVVEKTLAHETAQKSLIELGSPISKELAGTEKAESAEDPLKIWLSLNAMSKFEEALKSIISAEWELI